ncbi:MAG: FlgB family protein [Pseudomonadota bacterium]
MFDRLEILQLARGMAAYSGARQTVLAENVANANTPGYRARDLPEFAEAYRSSTGSVELRQTRSGHVSGEGRASPLADPIFENLQADPTGNTVSVERELTRAADIRSDHNRALAVYSSSLDIIRAAIGRAR